MPYTNSDKNTEKEFYIELARLLDVTVPTAKRYFVDGVYEAIVRLTWARGKCTIPHFGTITLVNEPEYFQTQKNEKGEEVIYKVPARDKPVFTPHDTFINDVNFMGVTKAYRKRVKKNQLTGMDYRRQQRAIELGDFGSKSQERLEKAKEDFQEKLKQKKEAKANASDETNGE